MTLVVSVMTDTSVYMISDAILSVKAEESVTSVDYSYPTKPTTPITGVRRVAGLSQKIVSIRDGLFLGWSGDYDTALRFLDFIRISLKNCDLNREAALSAQKDYFYYHREDEGKIHTMIALDTADTFFLVPQGEIQVVRIPDVGTVYVMGSGTNEFLDYFGSQPPKRFTPKSGQPLDMDMIHYFMSYITKTINAQVSTGFGVGEGWGGWFEILLKKGGMLEKLDSIMYATMYVGQHEGRTETIQIGQRYMHYYEGERLIVLSQSKNAVLRLNVISPPDQKDPSEMHLQSYYPQLLCLNLVQTETKQSDVTLSYNALGHSYCGLGESVDGKGFAIRINTNWLASILNMQTSINNS